MKYLIFILSLFTFSVNAQIIFPFVADSKLATQNVTATTTLTDWNKWIGVSASATTTVTLPTAVGNAGKQIVLKRTDNTGNTVTIDPAGSETIDGLADMSLIVGSSITVYSDGVNCYVSTSATPTTTPLVYGRVNASTNLTSKSFVSTGVGTTVDFTASVYSSGMTFSGTNGIIPSVTGRYRASYYLNTGSDETANNATIRVVQGGVSLGSVYINQHNSAGSVNQTSNVVDFDAAAGVPVFLNYQPDATEAVAFDQGSYFQLTQLPTAIAPVVNTVAECIVPQYAAANVTPTSVQNTSANAAQFMAINIPSAGTWDIEWSVLGQVWQGNGGGTNDGIASGLYDAAGTFITNTELASASIASAGSTTGSNLYIQGTRSTTLVTTSATTYNVKVWNPNGLTRATAGSGVQGRSYVKATKIAGQLPSTGQTVDKLHARQTTTQGAPTVNTIINLEGVVSGNIPFASNTATLEAGKTYLLEGTGAIMTGGSSAYGTRFFNVTTGQFFGESSYAISPNNGNTSTFVSRNAVAEITPSVTTQVQLRVDLLAGAAGTIGGSNLVNAGSGAGSNQDPNGASWVRITQLGSSAYTTLNTFIGSNGVTGGVTGGVPAPLITDNTKFLKGDGTWSAATASLTSGQNLGIVNNSITNSVSFVDIPGSSFTLPAAGTYMVTYDVQGTCTGLSNVWGGYKNDYFGKCICIWFTI